MEIYMRSLGFQCGRCMQFFLVECSELCNMGMCYGLKY